MSIRCPLCNSDQLSTNKVGFGVGKGAVVAGPIGLAAGAIGSNKLEVACLGCGNTFAPVEGAGSYRSQVYLPENEPAEKELFAGLLGPLRFLCWCGVVGAFSNVFYTLFNLASLV